MENKRIAIVTGGTGLLGSWLIYYLLKNKKYHQILSIVRGSSSANARTRQRKILSYLPVKLNVNHFRKLIVINGDITSKNLLPKIFLKKAEYSSLVDIFHSAAVADFGMSIEELQGPNVRAVENIFKLALKIKSRGVQKNVRVHHISTAATGGTFSGKYFEKMLDLGQAFHNGYEESKYEAEKVAQEFQKDKKLQVYIYRPAIITGDSKHGVTTNFKMIYQPLHFLSRGLFSEIPAERKAYLSLVPVDKVAEAITILGNRSNVENATFHLTNPNEIQFGRFIDFAGKSFGFKVPTMTPLSRFDKNKISAAQLKLIEPFLPYFNYKLRFDSRLTNAYLKKQGFEWPKVDSKLLSILFKFCKKTNFTIPV